MEITTSCLVNKNKFFFLTSHSIPNLIYIYIYIHTYIKTNSQFAVYSEKIKDNFVSFYFYWLEGTEEQVKIVSLQKKKKKVNFFQE